MLRVLGAKSESNGFPLSSLERFCVRQGDKPKWLVAAVTVTRSERMIENDRPSACARSLVAVWDTAGRLVIDCFASGHTQYAQHAPRLPIMGWAFLLPTDQRRYDINIDARPQSLLAFLYCSTHAGGTHGYVSL